MTRTRTTVIGLLVAFALTLFAYPALLTHTHAFGYTATARVDECRPGSGRPNSGTRCGGTWTAPNGEHHDGRIHGVGRGDLTHTVTVHVGPLGARTGSLFEEPGFLFPLGLFALVYGGAGYMLMRNRAARTAREARFLAVPGGTYLRARPTQVTTLDGDPYLTLQPSGDDATARDPAGEPLFRVAYFEDADHEPELHVRTPSGTTRVLIQRTSRYPAHFRFVTPDGEPAGEADTDGAPGDLVLTDAAGREIAALCAGTRHWLVRIPPGTPRDLRELALACALYAGPLHL